MIVSHRTLAILAALLWYGGVTMLLTKGGELAQDAHHLEPEKMGQHLSWIAGILIGVVKTKYIFVKSCNRNMARINALESPKLWQFYRPQFFIALTVMIILGSFLSHISQGNHTFLVAIAILDISIGTALFLSSYVFFNWNRKELLPYFYRPVVIARVSIRIYLNNLSYLNKVTLRRTVSMLDWTQTR